MTAAAATKPDRRRLAHLLRAAHSPLDPDGVAELVAGVLAAPEEIGASWHRLVADPIPPARQRRSRRSCSIPSAMPARAPRRSVRDLAGAWPRRGLPRRC